MKNILKLYIWLTLLLIMVVQLKAQEERLPSIKKNQNRELFFLNLSLANYNIPAVGITYEGFLNDQISISGGFSYPYFRLELNSSYSIWLDRHRLYGGINLTAWLYNNNSTIFFGPKAGYQFYFGERKFLIGAWIIQWLIIYDAKFDSFRTAPLSAPSKLVLPVFGIDIGFSL